MGSRGRPTRGPRRTACPAAVSSRGRAGPRRPAGPGSPVGTARRAMRPISPGSLRFLLSCAKAASCACSALSSASVPCRSERWLRSDPAGNQAKSTTAAATIAPRKARRARPAGPFNQDPADCFAARWWRPACGSEPASRRGTPRHARLLVARQRRQSREAGRLTQVLLNPQQLVVLGHAVRTGRRARLDLSRVDRHRQVGDRRVLGLTRTVRDHRAVGGARWPAPRCRASRSGCRSG